MHIIGKNYHLSCFLDNSKISHDNVNYNYNYNYNYDYNFLYFLQIFISLG
jgi:hypothetical protein